jgi:hypothetical protein
MKRTKKGTIERLTEPVSDAAGAVVKSIKRNAPRVTDGIGYVAHSIGEVVSGGVEVVKEVGSKAIEGTSQLVTGGTNKTASKRHPKKKAAAPKRASKTMASAPKRKTSSAKRDTSLTKPGAPAGGARRKRSPSKSKITAAKVDGSQSTSRPTSSKQKSAATSATPAVKKRATSKATRRAPSK